MFDLSFYKDKKVLITGHTGFKGTWMCALLLKAGARVTGYALEPPTNPSIFELSGMEKRVDSVIGDVRDLKHMEEVFERVRPEIVIHMGAQPIVRESYKNPVDTYATNVMGTVNVLECVRLTPGVRSFLNVTTDKVYLNKEWNWGYRENEELNGYDPYSNSKSCSELVTSCYKNSFFQTAGDETTNGESNGSSNRTEAVVPAISTARAGNVIGGGDFAADRIIPDCVRTVLKRANAAGSADNSLDLMGSPAKQAEQKPSEQEIIVRNPYSTRPYQHVLEPVYAYLMIAAKQYEDGTFAGSYNVGPDEADCYTTGELVTLFCDKWNKASGEELTWKNVSDGGPHEANFLKLDCSKLKSVFSWKPVWSVETAMEKIVEWTIAYREGEDVYEVMMAQIGEFLGQ